MADSQLIASINACSTSTQNNKSLTAFQQGTYIKHGAVPTGLTSLARLLVLQAQNIMSTLDDALEGAQHTETNQAQRIQSLINEPQACTVQASCE